MRTKQLSISEFKAKCTKELRDVESGLVNLEITRHGKMVAMITKPRAEVSPSIKELMGSLSGTVQFADDYTAEESVYDDGDWDVLGS